MIVAEDETISIALGYYLTRAVSAAQLSIYLDRLIDILQEHNKSTILLLSVAALMPSPPMLTSHSQSMHGFPYFNVMIT